MPPNQLQQSGRQKYYALLLPLFKALSDQYLPHILLAVRQKTLRTAGFFLICLGSVLSDFQQIHFK
jgi:hypothetical protein